MINLKVSEKRDFAQVEKTRKLVMTVTTSILVLYLVVVSGMVGWWWYNNSKQVRLSVEAENLLGDLRALSEQEAVYRKLDSRVKLVKTFLDGRGDSAKLAATLKDGALPVVGWDYDLGGKQVVMVISPNTEEIKNYSGYLAENYVNVKIDSVNYLENVGWQGVISVSGEKKK